MKDHWSGRVFICHFGLSEEIINLLHCRISGKVTLGVGSNSWIGNSLFAIKTTHHHYSNRTKPVLHRYINVKSTLSTWSPSLTKSHTKPSLSDLSDKIRETKSYWPKYASMNCACPQFPLLIELINGMSVVVKYMSAWFGEHSAMPGTPHTNVHLFIESVNMLI